MCRKYTCFLAIFNLGHSGTFRLPLDVVGREKSALLNTYTLSDIKKRLTKIYMTSLQQIHCTTSQAGQNIETAEV